MPLIPSAEKPAVEPQGLAVPVRRSGWGFLEWFAVGQVVLPALLYFPDTQGLRIPIRMAPYLLSLVPLVWMLARKRRIGNDHPAQGWLIFAVLYLTLMIAHPTTNTVLAGVAQVFLYIAVMAPVFWAPGLVRDPSQVGRILAILFVWSSLNSIVGFLQIFYPDRWLPQEYSSVVFQPGYIEVISYIGPNGQRMMRPPGLSDSPGYACVAGTFTGLFGLIYATAPLPLLVKGLCLALAFIGTTVIYLTHVRANLLILAGMFLVYGGRFLLSRWKTRALQFIGLAVVLIVLCFFTALSLGGETIGLRFSHLWAADPLTVYRGARGGGFGYMLSEFPLGAGLGRWGMMHSYFGDHASVDSPSLWAEVQIAAWILDGGFILLFLYGMALIVTILHEWRIVGRSPDPGFQFRAAGAVAINAGTVAICLSYVPFAGQAGVQYWFFVGVLHGAARLARRQRHGNLSSS